MEAPNKIVLPGEVDIISYCALGSALAGQSGASKSFTNKLGRNYCFALSWEL
jgi:hypothetical protein